MRPAHPAATVSTIEPGVSNPSWMTVEAIAAALGVSMVEVARLAEKPKT